MKLLYYLTSHGYGHAVRATAICNCLDPAIHVVLRTTVPEKFFTRDLSRPFSLYPAEYDCGCVQIDSLRVDIDATLETYARIAARNEELLDREIQWVKQQNVGCIASDITPFAFSVASAAAIASVAVTNFTWYDIYEEYMGNHGWFRPVLAQLRQQYASADLLLALEPPMPMTYFKRRLAAPIVGRKGNNIRDALSAFLGIPDHLHIGLIYAGNWGLGKIDWKGLEKFGNWYFIGVTPLEGNPSNYRCIGNAGFRYQDLMATADMVAGKIGYSGAAECFLNGAPLLYVPRENFAEHPVMEKAVAQWGHGYRLSADRFRSLQWDEVLEEVAVRKRPEPVRSNGAEKCAR